MMILFLIDCRLAWREAHDRAGWQPAAFSKRCAKRGISQTRKAGQSRRGPVPPEAPSRACEFGNASSLLCGFAGALPRQEIAKLPSRFFFEVEVQMNAMG